MKCEELKFKFSNSENVLKLNAMNYNAIACSFHFATSATLMREHCLTCLNMASWETMITDVQERRITHVYSARQLKRAKVPLQDWRLDPRSKILRF